MADKKKKPTMGRQKPTAASRKAQGIGRPQKRPDPASPAQVALRKKRREAHKKQQKALAAKRKRGG